MATGSVSDICAEFSISIVPPCQRCGPGDTHAGGAISTIHRTKGADHLRLVLACLAADPANLAAIWSETIAAISDCLRFRSDWSQERLQAAFRRIDLRKHRTRAVRLRPWPVRHTLRSLIDMDLSRIGETAC